MSYRIPTACHLCGARKGTCSHSRQPRAPRGGRARAASGGRAYSDTAAYRAAMATLLERDGAVCAACGGPGDPGAPKGSPHKLELAHLVPHAAGGPFILENLALAHPGQCNRSLEVRAAS